MHALIIEDEFLVAISIEDALQAIGYTSFETAGTEASAVAAVKDQAPDLITADVRLANGSGIAAIRSILQRHAVPVVFITGNAELVRQELPEAVVIQKPFHDDMLRDAVALALDLSPHQPPQRTAA